VLCRREDAIADHGLQLAAALPVELIDPRSGTISLGRVSLGNLRFRTLLNELPGLGRRDHDGRNRVIIDYMVKEKFCVRYIDEIFRRLLGWRDSTCLNGVLVLDCHAGRHRSLAMAMIFCFYLRMNEIECFIGVPASDERHAHRLCRCGECNAGYDFAGSIVDMRVSMGMSCCWMDGEGEDADLSPYN
jgi:hypothetical protein